ncbi:UDP-N-acetylglucosamine 2-epimerase [Microbacterium mangrovi]|uniref:UDP-N-acetylglucosamine 2-epimerase (non-hydrolyzing) n=1 Tax=Microbacterium mangrovi TaxID=1348253 RepID=A0A0B2A9S1_9MICO|nr:UDP-N-acetylglucosamine 2-epimerase (non-hydrolyzing) [Microbacterium mangrovi]KHK99914.1 UDP-N-acetylglucosamine 2-epimerase [Microbacterium mangrovi]
MKKLMPVYGTRPEAIKMAPLVRSFAADPEFTVATVVTGQHRDMLDQVNRQFGIRPCEDLDIMTARQSPADVIARTIEGLDRTIARHAPDAVIVQGDTTSAMAAALAAFNRRVPVVHVEAGLRSGDLHSPFPEEGNRRVIGQIASLHLAPTPRAKKHLIESGIPDAAIATTGNTVVDALELILESTRPQFTDARVAAIFGAPRPTVLVTAHRRENHGAPMRRIGRALVTLAARFPDHDFLLPAHPHPAVAESLLPEVIGIRNLVVTSPLSYAEMAHVMARVDLVMTDSGGVQEEAPALGKPVLVLRENTERPEGVEAGTVRLVGTDPHRIIEEVSTLLTDAVAYERMARAVNPYGDGRAAERTTAAVRAFFGLGPQMPDFAPRTVVGAGASS